MYHQKKDFLSPITPWVNESNSGDSQSKTVESPGISRKFAGGEWGSSTTASSARNISPTSSLSSPPPPPKRASRHVTPPMTRRHSLTHSGLSITGDMANEITAGSASKDNLLPQLEIKKKKNVSTMLVVLLVMVFLFGLAIFSVKNESAKALREKAVNQFHHEAMHARYKKAKNFLPKGRDAAVGMLKRLLDQANKVTARYSNSTANDMTPLQFDQTGGEGFGLRRNLQLYDWNAGASGMIQRHQFKDILFIAHDCGPQGEGAKASHAGCEFLNSVTTNLANNFSKKQILHVRVDRDNLESLRGVFAHDAKAHLPIALLLSIGGGWRKYKLDLQPLLEQGEGVVTKKLIDFERGFFEGTLAKYLRSEERINLNSDDDVFVYPLVALDFKDRVMKNSQDVVILFYAAWCGHCQRILPIVEEASRVLSPLKFLNFYKMDSDLNDVDHDEFIVTKVPQIRIFKNNQKARLPPQFDATQELSVDELVDWVLSQLEGRGPVEALRKRLELTGDSEL